MYSRNDNMIETRIGSEKDEILEELFEFLLQKYQNCLEESMKGTEFVFDSVNLFYYKCHK